MRVIIVFLLLHSLFCHSQNYNYYFGNLHAHTAFSDGNKDSVSTGMKTPAQSYAYAKLSDDFDFLGISEHNHYNSARNPGFRRPRYQEGLQMAEAANEDGNFLTLFGMEFGVSSNYHGHAIIYGFDKLIGWENSVPGLSGKNYEIYNGKSDYDSLFIRVKNNPGAFCYLAHPDFNQFSSHGTSDDPLAWAPYNPVYDSAIVGMPLRSGLATSAATNYNDYSQGNYFTYFRRLLYVGYHLGIGYDHDNHYSNFGRSNGGRLVIIAPSLTRSNLISAMQKMSFYGSDDSNAKIGFEINGNRMGAIAEGTVYPTISIVHNDPDGENADSIKIWKGHKGSGGLWAQIIHTSLNSNTSGYLDTDLKAGTEYYYFAEIKQKDGHWIVTSPIWYTWRGSVGLSEPVELYINFFPNPADGVISISVAECLEHQLKIIDLFGKTLSACTFYDQNFELNTSQLKEGVYLLELSNKKGLVRRRIEIRH